MARRELRDSINGLMAAALLIGGVGFSSGCVEQDTHEAQELATARQSIQGGEEDREHPAAVGLFSTSSGGLCSGTLIAPNLVLTAQHCVARVESEQVICGQTSFGQKHSPRSTYVTTHPYLTRDGSNYTGVQEILVPEGTGDMCGEDIALLILRDNIPASEAVPIAPRVDAPVVRGEIYTAIGYGHTGDGSGAGVRRILEGLEVDCEGSHCQAWTSVQSNEFLGDAGTCQGDSGGPALDEHGRVLGALSRGAAGCRSSVYSAVAGWRDWIRETGQRAADIGGYEAPAWVTTGTTRDSDEDGLDNGEDNCPQIANPEQTDRDRDGEGDACDPDADGDGVGIDDNCPLVTNGAQSDSDNDGEGDACDGDADGDDVQDDADNCPFVDNADQRDLDNDDIGDACDDEQTIVVTKGGNSSGSTDEGGCSVASGASPERILAQLAGMLLLFGFVRVRRWFR